MSDSALHASGLNLLFKCGVQFEKRYIDGEIMPPGTAMVIGSTVHKAREVDLIHKRDSGGPLPVDAVADVADMEFERRWLHEAVELDAEEKSIGAARVKGASKDESILLARRHSRILMPQLQPLHVERKIRVSIPGIKHDLEGALDLLTNDGVLHDCKTSNKRLGTDAVEDSLQLPFYDLLVDAADGQRPKRHALDVVQKVKDEDKYRKKYQREAAYIVDVEPPDNHDAIIARIQRAERIIESGLFTPAPPDAWWCSNEWCGFALNNSCPFGPQRRRKSVAMNTDSEE